MPVLPDRSAIAARLFTDETQVVQALAAEAALDDDDQKRVAELARQLVAAVRAGRQKQGQRKCAASCRCCASLSPPPSINHSNGASLTHTRTQADQAGERLDKCDARRVGEKKIT